jgi:hypothetical protein
MFSAGRYEYRNKGLDMFIEALARLNYRLQAAGSNVTIVAFIITPAQTHSYTIDSLKGQAVTKQLKDTVTEIQNRIGSRLFDMAVGSNGYDFTHHEAAVSAHRMCKRFFKASLARASSVWRGQGPVEATNLRAQTQLSPSCDDAQHGRW